MSTTLNDFLIKAYEKGYRVDTEGNVISPKNNLIKTFRQNQEREYLVFSFRIEKDVRKIKVHRLQAYQKFGDEMFKEGIQVRHQNNNPLDNSWGNILIGTQSENYQDGVNKDKFRKLKKPGSKKFNSRLDKKKILEDLTNNIPVHIISKKYNISTSKLYQLKKTV